MMMSIVMMPMMSAGCFQFSDEVARLLCKVAFLDFLCPLLKWLMMMIQLYWFKDCVSIDDNFADDDDDDDKRVGWLTDVGCQLFIMGPGGISPLDLFSALLIFIPILNSMRMQWCRWEGGDDHGAIFEPIQFFCQAVGINVRHFWLLLNFNQKQLD